MLSFIDAFFKTIESTDAVPARPKRSDSFANVPVTNQFGESFQFKEDLIRGRAVVINTMFTICRGSCPGTNEKLRNLRVPLSKLFGKRVSIISITIDPKNDSRQAMLDYAENYGAGKPARQDECDWHFLTGTIENIETLRKSLGFYDLDAKVDSDISRHAALLLFGNDLTDRWATSPSQIREGLIFEPFRRILGTTTQERFGIKINSPT